ncbi:acetyl-CoA acetyltransferase [Sulfitobacter sp. F26204]|uniref:acetyl-CoA acetyltransferase n=1 Tax=Sulfitobacter sp. F26204 TaxID=2996014 RepID=UPI00225DD255|nr:acetyl-CoA acetyltransferase [Sulfitobacter sp. F26204]MCX7558913.1 acetyl-CoA acetyltransferase [Sulfitobacter sp. F26204]
MTEEPHPFHAVAASAAAFGLGDLELKVENDGAYVRLFQATPPLFFKHRKDPSDPIDRRDFNQFKRILLSEEDCNQGPETTLSLIKTLLVQFADYEAHR